MFRNRESGAGLARREGNTWDDGPEGLEFDEPEEEFHAPAHRPFTFDLTRKDGDDRRGNIQAAAGRGRAKEKFHEGRGVVILHDAPIKGQPTTHAFFVTGKRRSASGAALERFDYRFGSEFAGPHREKNSSGEDGVHEASGITDTQQSITNESSIVITEVGSGLDAVDEAGADHALLDDGTGFSPKVKGFFRRLFRAGEFFLVNDETHTGFLRGERDDPKPFVLKANNDGIEPIFNGRQGDVFEMTKDGNLFVLRMNNPKPFDISGHIAAAAGIDKKRSAETVERSIWRGRFDCNAGGIAGKFQHTPAFADIRTRIASMFEEDVIEAGTLDVKSLLFDIEFPFTENDVCAKSTIAQLENGAGLSEKAGVVKFGKDTHFTKKRVIRRQERFANVEAGKYFLLQGQDTLAGASQEG